MAKENQNFYYLDKQGMAGVGIFLRGKTVVFTGTSIHRENAAYRDCPATEPFRKAGFYFFYSDDPWEPDFYAVPAVLVVGHDNAGGCFATTEPDFALGKDVPLFYISPERRAYAIQARSSRLPAGEFPWKDNLLPTDAVKIFRSRAMAEREFAIHDGKELGLETEEIRS